MTLNPDGAFHFKLRRYAFHAAQGTFRIKISEERSARRQCTGVGDHCGDHFFYRGLCVSCPGAS